MKLQLRHSLLIVGVLGLVAAGCSLPSLPSTRSGASTTGSTTGSSGAGGSTGTLSLSVTNDGGQSQGVLVTSTGSKIDITAPTNTGSSVACAEPLKVAWFNDGSGSDQANKPAIILGMTSDHLPGIWVYSQGKIEAPGQERDGSSSPYLGDGFAHHGLFSSFFGWTFEPSSFIDFGNLIVAVAVNTKGVSFGRYHVSPGTKVAVYWRVHKWASKFGWDSHHHPEIVISPPRIIGTLNSSQAATHHGHEFHWGDHWAGGDYGVFGLFMLSDYSLYLSGVDQEGISDGTTPGSYVVTGTDQKGAAATATIAADGAVTITPTQTSSVADLKASAVTYAGSAVKAGTPFSATVNVTNSGSGQLNATVSVSFYLSTSSTYTPSGTPAATSPTENLSIAPGASVPVSANVTLSPTLSANTTEYLYATVVSGSTTIAAQPAEVYAYTSSTSSFMVNIDTFDPTTGSNSSSTLSSNPVLALYQKNSSGGLTLAAMVTGAPYGWNSGGGYFNSISAVTLAPGTYYLGVQGDYAAGAYGIGASDISSSYSPTTFTTALTSASALPTNNASTTIKMPRSTPSTGQTISAVPTNTVALKLGAAQNWYVANGTTDWFTVTLP